MATQLHRLKSFAVRRTTSVNTLEDAHEHPPHDHKAVSTSISGVECAAASVFSLLDGGQMSINHWSAVDELLQTFSEKMDPLLNCSHWYRLPRVVLKEYEAKGILKSALKQPRDDDNQSMLTAIGSCLKIPKKLIEQCKRTRETSVGFYATNAIFLTISVHGMRKGALTDFELGNVMNAKFWSRTRGVGRLGFGMYEEQVSLFVDPLAGYSLSVHEHHVHASFADLEQKFESSKSRFRQQFYPTLMIYGIIDGAIDGVFPIFEFFQNVLRHMEEVFKNSNGDVDRALISGSAMGTAVVMKCIQRIRMNHWQIREILTEIRQNEYGSLTIEMVDLLASVLSHLENNVEICNTLETSCKNVAALRLQLLSKKTEKAATLLANMSVFSMPLQFWTQPWSVNFETAPILHWRYSYLIFWIVNIIMGAAVSTVLLRVRSSSASLAVTEGRVSDRLKRRRARQTPANITLESSPFDSPDQSTPLNLPVALPPLSGEGLVSSGSGDSAPEVVKADVAFFRKGDSSDPNTSAGSSSFRFEKYAGDEYGNVNTSLALSAAEASARVHAQFEPEEFRGSESGIWDGTTRDKYRLFVESPGVTWSPTTTTPASPAYPNCDVKIESTDPLSLARYVKQRRRLEQVLENEFFNFDQLEPRGFAKTHDLSKKGTYVKLNQTSPTDERESRPRYFMKDLL